MNVAHVSPKSVTFRSFCVNLCSILFCSAIVGCFQTVLVEPSDLEEDNTEDIVVSTTDGWLVAFGAEDYTLITDEHGESFVRGKGKRFREGQSEYHSFEGDIPLEQIRRISHFETTPVFYISISLVVIVIGLYALLLGTRIGH